MKLNIPEDSLSNKQKREPRNSPIHNFISKIIIVNKKTS